MSAEGNAGPWKEEELRVLIVDDEKDFVLSLEDILESRGYPVENEKKHIDDFRLKIEEMLSIRIKKTERSDTTNLQSSIPGWVSTRGFWCNAEGG